MSGGNSFVDCRASLAMTSGPCASTGSATARRALSYFCLTGVITVVPSTKWKMVV